MTDDELKDRINALESRQKALQEYAERTAHEPPEPPPRAAAPPPVSPPVLRQFIDEFSPEELVQRVLAFRKAPKEQAAAIPHLLAAGAIRVDRLGRVIVLSQDAVRVAAPSLLAPGTREEQAATERAFGAVLAGDRPRAFAPQPKAPLTDPIDERVHAATGKRLEDLL